MNQLSISTGKTLSGNYFKGAVTSKQDIWFKIILGFTFIHDPFIRIENTTTRSDQRDQFVRNFLQIICRWPACEKYFSF
jgi:hypothetical protein